MARFVQHLSISQRENARSCLCIPPKPTKLPCVLPFSRIFRTCRARNEAAVGSFQTLAISWWILVEVHFRIGACDEAKLRKTNELATSKTPSPIFRVLILARRLLSIMAEVDGMEAEGQKDTRPNAASQM